MWTLSKHIIIGRVVKAYYNETAFIFSLDLWFKNELKKDNKFTKYIILIIKSVNKLVVHASHWIYNRKASWFQGRFRAWFTMLWTLTIEANT